MTRVSSDDEEYAEVFFDDYYEYVGHYTVTRSALKTLSACKQVLDPNRLYTTAEIRRLIYQVYKRALFGRNSVSADLHNLWRCRQGGVRKFARSKFAQSGRPYNVRWQVGEE